MHYSAVANSSHTRVRYLSGILNKMLTPLLAYSPLLLKTNAELGDRTENATKDIKTQ